MICPNGHGFKPGTFCEECGEKLVPVQQEDPQEGLEVFGEDNCPNCSYQLRGHQTEYCPGCGKPLNWLTR